MGSPASGTRSSTYLGWDSTLGDSTAHPQLQHPHGGLSTTYSNESGYI